MTPTPLPATNELWKEVDALLVSGTDYQDRTLEVRILIKKIEALKNVSAGEAFLLLAHVHQLTGDIESMHDALHKAKNLVSSYKYATGSLPCLLNSGYFSEAQDQARIACDVKQGMFSTVFPSAAAVGIFTFLSEQMEVANKMQLPVDETVRNTIAKANSIVTHYGLTEAVIGEVLDVAGEVFRANRFVYYGEPNITIWGIDEYEDVQPHISFDFQIARSASAVADLRFELADRIANSKLGHYPDGLNLCFLCADKLNQYPLAA